MKSPSMILKHAWYIFERTVITRNDQKSQNATQNTTGIVIKDSKAGEAFSDIAAELNL